VPVADLHVHTTNSDGSLALAAVPEAARAAGIEAVAITDHDRLHPDLDAPIAERGGVTVIHGIELRVEASELGSSGGGQGPDGGRASSDGGTATRLDLLGYGVRPTPDLTAELDRIQTDRVERGRRIVADVERELGVDLGIDVEPGIGRPHVARAIADSAADYDYEGAFAELIGDGRPFHHVREVPSFERGAALLDGACGLVSLAHPLRYDDPERALALADHLDGVERHYDYGRTVDPAPVERAIERFGLLPTGGSDAHDATLGRAGLGAADYRRVRARLGAG
jgi:predicted metal-dependent phosphoesterase TrpH